MSTIKEIAEKTKLSVGTVSVVLNGRGDEMRISKKTQQRILEAAQGFGYVPNMSARRLRQSGVQSLPIIATFWPSDLSSDLLGRFFMGAQSPILEQEYEFEMTIQPFKRNNIHRIKEICDSGMYHGVILTGISAEDQRFFEAHPLSVPAVLFNRYSSIYSCVHVDTYEIGRKTAELFAMRGHRKVGTIVPDHLVRSENNLRFKGFVESCARYGLELEERHIQAAPMTMEGGYSAARKIVDGGGELPTAMFFPLGTMAVAALPVFNRANIKIPDEMEILTYGDHDAEKYSVPSLSTVKLPVEEMAAACIRLAMGRVLDPSTKAKAIVFETPFIFRESCGEFIREI
ncbi:LacI family DNA-binding transcriptional regulator [Paenibacillus xylaniclasticus]|uniref:LacI family DNA-binding transcriptional regulator n=1 Tax=Paenibacillus xylaniclasticus TaxID=588083 RepID=UPI000FD8397E|nr:MULTISPECIES: LacI family DNA-binding transcriptional regulator [Paenibacillus]GFN33497.1 LacI family transcriptional regulator [Paenibacillus curdlanolyticus]